MCVSVADDGMAVLTCDRAFCTITNHSNDDDDNNNYINNNDNINQLPTDKANY